MPISLKLDQFEFHAASKARALHVIADLLDDYPGIDAPLIASWFGEIRRCTAIELNAGRDVLIGILRALRHLADAVRVEMQPPSLPRTADGGALLSIIAGDPGQGLGEAE